MSNSVVKVTDSHVDDDKLMLLVSEDGTIAPDKETVQSYLNSRLEATDIQIMHINCSDGNSININVDNVVYMPNGDGEEQVEDEKEEVTFCVSHPMYSIKLDHDYTPHLEAQEIDELAKTLSILDGGGHIEDKPPPPIQPSNIINKDVEKIKYNKQIKTIQRHPEKVVRKLVKTVSQEEDVGQEQKKKVKPPPVTTTKPEAKLNDSDKKHKVKKPEPESPKQNEKPIVQSPDKKTPTKKDKKPNKPIPDDFALFSTPDIIRRVGQEADKSPAKIENRSRSANEPNDLIPRQNRLSLDGKTAKILNKESMEKHKQIEIRKSTETPLKTDSLEQMVEDLSSMETNEPHSMDPVDNPMGLDGSGLDIDPSLLENINNDEISEDLLYQVAQSLVSNTELQNAIDKSINDGSLVLDNSMDVGQLDSESNNAGNQQDSTLSALQKGTQIIRPDGRVVVIPPIERPTTRSRNKTINLTPSPPKLPVRRKPLDDEHVSGNELDSSADEQEEEEEEEEDEEEGEDDPNKLWCICNQPHNNRFMICCDTCEEWYHGKCVNITKAMGQQMESEGREWICLFCKDPKLKRPQAAARRIRRASRNSRQSTDSTDTKSDSGSGSVPCVACQKPSRPNSIFCGEACILTHAQGVERSVERVLVFERSTGIMLSGNKAPSATNLEEWLKTHPSYEVVKSGGKIVTTKPPSNMVQSKLKLIKNSDGNGVSLGTFKKSTNMGVLKHLPPKKTQQLPIQQQPHQPQTMTTNKVNQVHGIKIISKSTPQKVPKTIQKPAVSTPVKPKIIVKTTPKEKPVPVKTPKSRQIETPQKKQENIRENIQRTLYEQLKNRLKQDGSLKLEEAEVRKISVDIESQMYKCFGDTGHKYKTKYRSLIFNIKDAKNQTLWRRICERSINPYELVRLSPDDMASQELAMWREQKQKHELDMIKKSEMELLNCTRQYVLKTHKGEQVLEDNWTADHIDNTEVITSLTAGSGSTPTDKNESKEKSSKETDKESTKRSSSSSKHNRRDKDRKSDNKGHHSSHKASSKDRDRSSDKRSRSRDRSSKHSNRKSRSRHRKSTSSTSSSTHKTSTKHKKDLHKDIHTTDKLDKKSKEILEQLVDNKIVAPLEDKAWKQIPPIEDPLPVPLAESDSDHEPSSTVTIPTPPRTAEPEEEPSPTTNPIKEIKQTEEPRSKTKEALSVSGQKVTSQDSPSIWRGTISMIDVATISITAHEVQGDCNGLGSELPPHLDIVGRISPDTVWDYIGKMKCSNSKMISLVRLTPTNSTEKISYTALYEYLSCRNRLGVVKSLTKAVKDFYILPQAPSKPLPQALLPISGLGFEEIRPALLLGIIVRDKRKRPIPHEPTSVSVKKVKVEIAIAPTSRSYTPPPVTKDPRLKLPLPPPIGEQDDDEPYSPEDSDPDGAAPTLSVNETKESPPPGPFLTSETSTFQPFDHKFSDIPGLDSSMLPSTTLEIQRQMEKINKEIEMQKSEINSISQTIASTDIGSNALANIALPSDLQQILDSIKTIGAPQTSNELTTNAASPPASSQESDLTIPLILPPISSRNTDQPSIPLQLPTTSRKTTSQPEKTSSVLSSLSEADLIRKAEEMLGDTRKPSPRSSHFTPKRPRIDFLEEEEGEPRPPGVDD